jgi:hypothetical protein
MDRIKTKDLARGRWKQVLPVLGIPSKALTGRHGPCIFCGGKDRARFTNRNDEGVYFCNQCGSVDGFGLLMKFHGWDFKRAAQEVDRLFSINTYASLAPGHYQQIVGGIGEHVPKSTKDCALWLRKFHPEKLGPWLDDRPPEVRFWLETQE